MILCYRPAVVIAAKLWAQAAGILPLRAARFACRAATRRALRARAVSAAFARRLGAWIARSPS